MGANSYQLLILGSGPAGATAAIYAARANLKAALITGKELGGQIATTPHIANWPGEPEGITGAQLMEQMLRQVRELAIPIINDQITQVDLQQRPLVLTGEEQTYHADTLIIATGASPRHLGIPSEQRYHGRGVSTCAVCDGYFYRNQTVVIVGGGNTMAEEALYLAKIVSKLIIVHRRDTLRAEDWLIQRLHRTPNIEFKLNTVIDEILGDDHGVTGVRIKDLPTLTTQEIAVQGVFVAIGHEPNSQIFSSQLTLDSGNFIVTQPFSTRTNLPGVFAAGDVVARNFRQAIVAAGSGCTAALEAKDFLLTHPPV